MTTKADGEGVRPGAVYRNTKKGGLYRVVLLATHSEDDTPMVVYQELVSGRHFVRPLELFTGARLTDTGPVPRFVAEDTSGQS